MEQQASWWMECVRRVTTARMNISHFGRSFRLEDVQGRANVASTALRQACLQPPALPQGQPSGVPCRPSASSFDSDPDDPLSKIMECLLAMSKGKPVWIHKTAVLARTFDCTPEVFESCMSTLLSLGAILEASDGQIRLTKHALES